MIQKLEDILILRDAQKSKKIINKLLNTFEEVVKNYQEVVEIFSQRNQEKVLPQNQITLKDNCQTIDMNIKTNTIAAKGQNIVIWKENFCNLQKLMYQEQILPQFNQRIYYQYIGNPLEQTLRKISELNLVMCVQFVQVMESQTHI